MKNNEIIIPPKINEIISYLAHAFSSKVLEKADIKQDLYLVYIKTIRKNPESAKNKPGWFFLKFKWFLCTKYTKEVKRINREWDYKLRHNPDLQKLRDSIGYLEDKNSDKLK